MGILKNHTFSFQQVLIILILMLMPLPGSLCNEYPDDPMGISPLLIGSKIPNMIMSDQHGNFMDLRKLVWDVPAVVIFYRGGWSEYCTHHLKQLNSIRKKVEKLNCRIIVVSPDLPRFLYKTQSQERLKYLMLSDSSMTVASYFGIAYRVNDEEYRDMRVHKGIDLEIASGNVHHLLPVPATFIIDSSGTVRFSYVNPNEKERIQLDLLLEAIKAVSRHFPTDLFTSHH